MDFKSILDTLESFGIGLAIILAVLFIMFAIYVAFTIVSNIHLNIPKLLDALFEILLFLCILIAFGILSYFIGKVVKKPLKNKIMDGFNSNNQNSFFCPHCGIKLKAHAKFCDNCGEKVNS